MRLRVFLIEPKDAICGSLELFLEELGHEVVRSPAAESCPHFHAADQACSRQQPCADAVILGQQLSKVKGIELIERRVRGGCRGMVANVALLCLPWSDSDRLRAEALGCRYFETPLRLAELADWLQTVAQRTDPQRQLAPLSHQADISVPAAGAR
ncbi:MAG: response regulator [Desulfuromonadales bacterium]|nr:response regulator [Desulfuromonadales bacterium]